MDVRPRGAAAARCHPPGNALAPTTRTVTPGEARQQVLRRVERDDAARLHHRDAAAQRFRFLEVMRRQDDRVPVAIELADECPQALPQLDVDARRRLVQHDHRRLVHQRLADQHAPLHAARQRAHVGVRLAGRGRGDAASRRSTRRCCASRNSRTGCAASRAPRRTGRTRAPAARRRARGAPRGNRRRRRGRECARCRDRRASSPARIEISVVLPAPFGPSSPKNSPCATARSTPASACTVPKRRATSTTSTAFIGNLASGTPARVQEAAIRQVVVDAVDDGQRTQRRAASRRASACGLRPPRGASAQSSRRAPRSRRASAR